MAASHYVRSCWALLSANRFWFALLLAEQKMSQTPRQGRTWERQDTKNRLQRWVRELAIGAWRSLLERITEGHLTNHHSPVRTITHGVSTTANPSHGWLAQRVGPFDSIPAYESGSEVPRLLTLTWQARHNLKCIGNKSLIYHAISPLTFLCRTWMGRECTEYTTLFCVITDSCWLTDHHSIDFGQ